MPIVLREGTTPLYIDLDFSNAGTLFWYNQASVYAFRFRGSVETGIGIGSIRVRPGFNYIRDILAPDEQMTWLDLQISF